MVEVHAGSSEQEPIELPSPLYHSLSWWWRQSVTNINFETTVTNPKPIHRKFAIPEHVTVNKLCKYLVFKEIVPSLATQDVADGELHEVKWEIEDNTVEPNHSCPTPTNSLDPCKTPVGIHCYYCSNLHDHKLKNITPPFYDSSYNETSNILIWSHFSCINPILAYMMECRHLYQLSNNESSH